MGQHMFEKSQLLCETVTPFVSHSLPLGEPLPPDDPHALSVSMPSWECIPASLAGEEWAIGKMQTSYPRFDIHRYVKELIAAVSARLKYSADMGCMIFPSEDAARRCTSMFKNKDSSLPLHSVRFLLSSRFNAPETAKWATFFAVLYHTNLEYEAAQFWEHFGDGISSRHALFCLAQFQFLDSEPADSGTGFLTAATSSDISAMPFPDWTNSAVREKWHCKSLLAECARSRNPNQKLVRAEDVFLYPNGMCAISAIARGLAQQSSYSEAVVYGWPYAGTVPCVKACGYNRFTMYGHGTEEELDQLESSLASGSGVAILFCEIPSNPQLQTPDLHRIRDLADQYGFVVVCDDTMATTVNVDILPYVDVVISSLTKVFSGACNVMGGSLLINPNSEHYNRIRFCLEEQYEDVFFPQDVTKLAQNCSDFIPRVHKCNETALKIANLFAAHPSIEFVSYPSMVSSSSLYERYRRENGGYGYLLSIVFREPESAVRFYDCLDICKGPSVGTNFSIALAYSILAHADELEWAAAHGVPKHIVRISVGLEAQNYLGVRITQALREVERFEREGLKEHSEGSFEAHVTRRYPG